jgi:1-acyl-sn-glycerol-3-phosphate acyltransferase
VAIHGSARVRNWRRGEFPKVTILYGDPFRFEQVESATREQSQAVADQILVEIVSLYRQLADLGRAGVLARIRQERRTARGGRAMA